MFVPCLIYGIWRNAKVVILWKTITIGLVFFLGPIFTTQIAYKIWNHHRSGEMFTTSSARKVILIPLLRMTADGAQVFTGNSKLEKVSRMVISGPEFTKDMEGRYTAGNHIRAINNILKKHGLNIVEISRQIEIHFFTTLVTQPFTALRYMATQLRPSLIRIFFQPIYGVTFFAEASSQPYGDIGRYTRFNFLVNKAILENLLWPYALLAIEAITRLTSIAIGLSMLLGLPLIVLLQFAKSSIRLSYPGLQIFMATIFIGISCIYSLIHIEPRYLMVVLGPGIIAAIPSFRVFCILITSKLYQLYKKDSC